jgi:hypothetical protein
MPTREERLDRWERRQEDLIAAISSLADICALTNATVTQIAALLMQPPKSDLADLIKGLTVALQGLQDQTRAHSALIVGLGQRLGEMPAEVARAVSTGEVT